MRQESTESDTIDRLYSIECHKRALLRAHRDHSENMSEHNPDSILRVKRYFHHHQEQTHDVITTLFSVFTRTNVIWQNASFLSVAPLIPYSEKHCSFLEFSLPLVVTGGPLHNVLFVDFGAPVYKNALCRIQRHLLWSRIIYS